MMWAGKCVVAYWRLFYHLVWSTKKREPSISQDLETVISRSFDLTCDDLELIVHARGFMPDHVHIAVSIPPKVAQIGLAQQNIVQQVLRFGSNFFFEIVFCEMLDGYTTALYC